jgi:hypothetical protein
MTKPFYILILALTCIAFTSTDCKRDTCPTCPSPPTDSTSHNFSWQTYALGDGSSSSTLYDVAIINDTLAYAVGEIYYNTSICNLARWNGQRWDTMHVSVTLTYTSSQMVTDQDPLKTVFAFDANDIWVVSQAGGVSHWNGAQWVMLSIPFNQGPGACNRIWGTSSSNLYFVGNNGRIIHYNGTSWTKIESGTTLNIYDVYGAYNSVISQWEILAVAEDVGSSNARKILKITGTTASSLSDTPIAWPLNGVWFVPGEHYYVVGSGIYEKNSLSESNWTVHLLDITTYYTGAIRGNATNDVIVGGAYGELLHYNGSTWKSYISEVGLGSNGVYGSVAIRNNLVIAVGENNPLAAIAIGKR